jgi:uncharacterized protein
MDVEANDLRGDNQWASLPNLRIWIRNDWWIRQFGSCRINVTIRSKVRRMKRIPRHHFSQNQQERCVFWIKSFISNCFYGVYFFVDIRIIECPQEVRVKTIQSDHTMVLELRVAKDDIGKVIGKQGRTAQAMRTLLDVVSAKIKKRTVLEIVE